MKTLEELKEYFEQEQQECLDEWFEKFTEETNYTDIYLFLAYLSQQHLVSQERMDRIQTKKPVDLSKTESIAEGFVEAASSLATKMKVTNLNNPSALAMTGEIEKELPLTDLEEEDTGSIEDIGPTNELEVEPIGKSAKIAHEKKIAEPAPHLQNPRTSPESGDEHWGAAKEPSALQGFFDLPANSSSDEAMDQTQISGEWEDQTISALEENETPDPSREDGAVYEATVTGSALSDALKIIDDNHLIQGELGRGAMGVVFLAQEVNLGRKVALKQLRPDIAIEHELMMRFLREAQITAQLDHPAIIPVYSLIKGFQGLPAYTMKVVEGETLDSVIKKTKKSQEEPQSLKSPYSLRTRLEYFITVCNAMAYAHNKGVLHRDLKPQNILVGHYGEVYVVDWGLSRLMFSKENATESDIQVQSTGDYQTIKTQVGRLMGTPQYMSPEQAQGMIFDMDGRSDLYSLGTILYELIYLERAIRGENLLEIVNRVVRGEIREIPADSPHEQIPQEIPEIIRKATAAKKQDRYDTVKELADALRDCLRTDTIATSQTTEQLAFSTNDKKTSPVGWIAAVMIFFLMAGGLFGLRQQLTAQYTEQNKQNKERRQTLQARQKTSTQHAQHMDKLFFQFEQLTLQLTSSARTALLQKKLPKKPLFYLHRSFSPPDLTPSAFYREKISQNWPVIKLLPKQKPRNSKLILAQLSTLRPVQKSILLQTLSRQKLHKSERFALQQMKKTGLLALSNFVATKSGELSMYPGRASYPDEYNPTLRPWYKAALGQKGLFWSRPYVNSQKIRSVQIACLSAIFAQKKMLGVAGISMQLNALALHLEQKTKKAPWIREALILDQEGRTIVSTGRRLEAFAGTHLIKQALQMPTYPKKKLLSLIKKGKKAGYLVSQGGNTGYELLVYRKLGTLGWYYLSVSNWPKHLLLPK